LLLHSNFECCQDIMEYVDNFLLIIAWHFLVKRFGASFSFNNTHGLPITYQLLEPQVLFTQKSLFSFLPILPTLPWQRLPACKRLPRLNTRETKDDNAQKVVVEAYNPSTQEAQAGGVWVPSQLGYIEKPCLKRKKKDDTKISQCYLYHI
jgi:hypothetical protein